MNNLHRELAPISAVAWADLEEEARRTFKRHVAGRRVVDVPEPGGLELSAITTGHLDAVAAPAEGVIAHVRRSHPIVELRVPFTVDRQQVDDVERGARDTDWQPVKDAAKQIAFAEDRALFEATPPPVSPASETARRTRRWHSLWVPKTRPCHATWAYSWMSPPSRSTCTTRMPPAGAAGGTAATGDACPRARCGRWSL